MVTIEQKHEFNVDKWQQFKLSDVMVKSVGYRQMRPIDIKGRPIYSKVFSILQQHGNKLLALGWRESANKPNLFYKEFYNIMVFADMRGTEIISIWDEPYPFIYADGKSEDDWKIRRAIRKALGGLDSVNVPHRFSFYEECEPDGLFFGDEEELADGKCKVCSKEFDTDGLYCSIECEKVHLELKKKRQEEFMAEMHAQRKARKLQSATLVPKKRKEKAKKVKLTLDEPNLAIQDQQLPSSFDLPSEVFKKRKASRDRVKHPRY